MTTKIARTSRPPRNRGKEGFEPGSGVEALTACGFVSLHSV
jgi:hypothetical protein